MEDAFSVSLLYIYALRKIVLRTSYMDVAKKRFQFLTSLTRISAISLVEFIAHLVRVTDEIEKRSENPFKLQLVHIP